MTITLLRDATGRVLGGASTDLAGRWTWWARANGSRRVRADDEAAALRALRAACPGAVEDEDDEDDDDDTCPACDGDGAEADTYETELREETDYRTCRTCGGSGVNPGDCDVPQLWEL